MGIESVEQVVPFLLDSLGSADPEVRRQTAQTLGEFRDPAALDGLAIALGDDDESTRAGAARSLGMLNIPEAVPPLAGAFSDPSAVVRANAADALSRVAGFLSSFNVGVDSKEGMLQALSSAVPSLVRALRDDDDHVRENAARALGGFDSDAESHLLAALDDPSERVRCEIVVALGRLQAPESVPLLIDLMRHADHPLRYEACQVLHEMGSVEALPAFIAALKDSNRGIRERSARALGDIGDRQAARALIAALDEWDRRVRERVVMALGKLGDRQAVPALLSALRDLRGSSPRSVGTALALLVGDQAWEGVLNAAEVGSLSLTHRIARLLGESGYVQGMPRLRALLDSHSGLESVYPAMALRLLEDTITGPEMVEELASDTPWRCARAA